MLDELPEKFDPDLYREKCEVSTFTSSIATGTMAAACTRWRSPRSQDLPSAARRLLMVIGVEDTAELLIRSNPAPIVRNHQGRGVTTSATASRSEAIVRRSPVFLGFR